MSEIYDEENCERLLPYDFAFEVSQNTHLKQILRPTVTVSVPSRFQRGS